MFYTPRSKCFFLSIEAAVLDPVDYLPGGVVMGNPPGARVQRTPPMGGVSRVPPEVEVPQQSQDPASGSLIGPT